MGQTCADGERKLALLFDIRIGLVPPVPDEASGKGVHVAADHQCHWTSLAVSLPISDSRADSPLKSQIRQLQGLTRAC